MQTYLDKDKIKNIINHLKTHLPKEKLRVVRFWLDKGIELNYNQNHQDNINRIWQYIVKEFEATTPKDSEIYKEYERNLNLVRWNEAGDVIKKTYVKKHYLKEYEPMKEIDLPFIYSGIDFINGIVNRVELHKHINLIDLIKSDDWEAYLEDNFGVRTVDKKLLEVTDRIAKLIDSQYFGRRGDKEYMKYQYAIKKYMITGDKNLLHNLLNNE